MTDHISPFAPDPLPVLPPIAGVRMAAMAAGIKYEGRTDLMAMVFDADTNVAGVLTTSRCPSAAVETCRMHLPHGAARMLVVNSGNANAFTGMAGRQAAEATINAAAKVAGIDPQTVFISSTGVIGEPMDTSDFEQHLEKLHGEAVADGWTDAARAIMTTDTFPKMATRTVMLDGKTVTINGIAKGAGMIAPDMATMLVYVVTDAAIEPGALQSLLTDHVDTTFNAISIDSDTSTSDTLLAFATGQAGNTAISDRADEGYEALSNAFAGLMHDLALMVVSDGEGLSKRIRVDVAGAATDASAKRIARTIVDSPLVKTAIAGQDANWGRIVMAVGKAGEPADRDRLEIRFGDIIVAREGQRAADYSEDACAAYMRNAEIVIGVDLHLGPGAATMWGCDLTTEYVAINADYRS